jgi:hypothetical protein
MFNQFLQADGSSSLISSSRKPQAQAKNSKLVLLAGA